MQSYATPASSMSKPKFGRIPLSTVLDNQTTGRGRKAKWAAVYEMIENEIGVLTSKTLTDQRAMAHSFRVPPNEKPELFRTAVYQHYNSNRETMLKNGFGVYTFQPFKKSRPNVIAIVKVAYTKEEIAEMFIRGGRGRGRFQQKLCIRSNYQKEA